MKEKVLLLTLNQAFKSVNNFKTDKEKINAFDFILGKSNELLTLAIIKLNLGGITDKKIKKEKDKLSLNLKIEQEVLKNKEILDHDEIVSKKMKQFLESIGIYKKLLQVK
jgi:hypothetical protein